MVPLISLWMPILLSAIVVFIASSIIHMVLGYHRADFARVPNEAAAMDAMRSLNLPPGDYMMPYAGTSAEMKDPAFLERQKKGPSVIMTVIPSGPPAMGTLLGQWFVYLLIVSIIAAYVTGRTVAPNAEYLVVFRVAGTVAFVGYALAQWPAVIWYRRSQMTTLRATVDGLINGLLTGGIFGWLWS